MSIASRIKKQYRHGNCINELCDKKKTHSYKVSIWSTTWGTAYTHGGENMLYEFEDDSAILVFPNGSFEVHRIAPEFTA